MQQLQQLAACKLSHRHNTAKHWRRASLHGRLLALALVQDKVTQAQVTQAQAAHNVQSWLFAAHYSVQGRQLVPAWRSQLIRHVLTTANYLLHGYVPLHA